MKRTYKRDIQKSHPEDICVCTCIHIHAQRGISKSSYTYSYSQRGISKSSHTYYDSLHPHEQLLRIRRVSNPSTGIGPDSLKIAFLVLIQNAGFVRDNGTK